MKYIVLHRSGTTWVNLVGNSLHVPFIDAETVEDAVCKAIARSGHTRAPMFLVCSPDGWFVVTPQSDWKVDPF
jgi:hypothetical protein